MFRFLQYFFLLARPSNDDKVFLITDKKIQRKIFKKMSTFELLNGLKNETRSTFFF